MTATVAVAALAGGASINTAGLMDALIKVDRAWRMLADPDDQPAFSVRLVGLHEGPVQCRDGVVLHPHEVADRRDPPDLVVVPGLDDDLESSFARNREWSPLIAEWHRSGSKVATSCTGAFIAADAGILDGKPATTHWIAARTLRRLYPRVRLFPQRMIVDVGDVITSGGATTFLTLVVYLTERFGGHERAILASKVMLVDGERRSQLPYVAFARRRDHADELVHAVQSRMEEDPARQASVDDLARFVGVSVRTLGRRFNAAVGETPRRYLQTIRIETAKRQLETTSDPVDRIMVRVGYQDPSAFRRAFVRLTGLGPRDYRRKFGPPA
jgi:transcriptional regulator GlxA family with amidase domain